jgi:YesN/AraC family two-component response regulator
VENNSLVFISNLESHQLRAIEYPYKRYFILIRPDCFRTLIKEPVLASVLMHRPDSFKHAIGVDPHDSREILNIFRAMNREGTEKKAHWEEAMGAHLHLLLILLYRKYEHCFPLSTVNNTMDTVLEVQKYVEEHFTEQISLREVSGLFYTNMYHLSHLFKKVTGFNFKEYVILQRIAKAKDLLFNTPDDVTTVGLNSGFGNVNHFIRIFRKYEGITPYQYRKRSR